MIATPIIFAIHALAGAAVLIIGPLQSVPWIRRRGSVRLALGRTHVIAVWIAMLALQGARAGDVLSIDWLARKLRKLPPRDVPRGYQWSLRLVQLAVALMFFSGMFHKIIHGHFTLRWALSELAGIQAHAAR